MQQQMQQMGQQMESMQAENQNLRKGLGAAKTSLSQMGESAAVESARNNLGLPTGQELPT
jgi:hypothetical protein